VERHLNIAVVDAAQPSNVSSCDDTAAGQDRVR
jgi:hypothetical protein